MQLSWCSHSAKVPNSKKSATTKAAAPMSKARARIVTREHRATGLPPRPRRLLLILRRRRGQITSWGNLESAVAEKLVKSESKGRQRGKKIVAKSKSRPSLSISYITERLLQRFPVTVELSKWKYSEPENFLTL